MPPYIEFCRQNVSPDSRQRLADTQGTADEKSCLQRCGTCYATPFLVVDGDLRTGESHAAILDRVTGGTPE